MNAIAGGGTLLTFPALVGLGIPGIAANATSTVALVPGALSAYFGYRSELKGAEEFAWKMAVPAALGGLTGALLLRLTPSDRFDAIVPFLVLGATALFVLQRPLVAWLRRDHAASAEPVRPTWTYVAYQYLVAIYGGYFGAGLGILVLAALGFLGFQNIHRMNGLKSWGGACTNLVAAVTFALSHLVDWKIAGVMSVGAVAGGLLGSKLAQRVPQAIVRRAIVVIGVASGLLLLR